MSVLTMSQPTLNHASISVLCALQNFCGRWRPRSLWGGSLTCGHWQSEERESTFGMLDFMPIYLTNACTCR